MSDHKAPARWRAVVDREECFGFAFCAAAVPAVFSLDAEGKSVALDVEVDPEVLHDAADACPRSAISVVRGEPPIHTQDGGSATAER